MYGCSGRAADPFEACAAHLTPLQLRRFAAGLGPGADLDLRGVTVAPGLLASLLEAVTGPDGRARLGRCRFEGALLPAQVSFARTCFERDCSFDGAAFVGGVSFFDARFGGHVSFRGTRFAGNATFHGASFGRHASFEEAVFGGDALFGETAWGAGAVFDRAVFLEAVAFDKARFGQDAMMRAACFGGAYSFRRVQVGRHARFERARFRHGLRLGPMAAAGRIDLADVTVHGDLHVHAAVRRITARGLTVHGSGEFRLRHTELDLEGAAFEGELAVRSLAQPLTGVTEPDDPDGPRARLASLRGVSARDVVLTDVDLTRCRFAGLRGPDDPASGGLRLSGHCAFGTVRPRWHRHGHAVLAEDPAAAGGLSDERLAVLYGRLARAAAGSDGRLARDFRYSALEMRRRTEPGRWRRWLLHALWLTCGYGLRAGRGVVVVGVLVALACCVVSLARHGGHQTSAHSRPAAPSTLPVHER
ncbi:pentapeptide repeat-containing protein [Actinomadura macrotermitis]|uniref:Pentapeptide repeat-containing protein n=1 Tax=Actinomadura macrotermitis TaxID=2585200 RepID=A0A7K0BVG4_9ACTN|nr:pentapeptide repeat-containing protein [Actinomadura macrotermitis]MQY04882.1 hypothetical protein [Actinomadura macrotermitis]